MADENEELFGASELRISERPVSKEVALIYAQMVSRESLSNGLDESGLLESVGYTEGDQYIYAANNISESFTQHLKEDLAKAEKIFAFYQDIQKASAFIPEDPNKLFTKGDAEAIAKDLLRNKAVKSNGEDTARVTRELLRKNNDSDEVTRFYKEESIYNIVKIEIPHDKGTTSTLLASTKTGDVVMAYDHQEGKTTVTSSFINTQFIDKNVQRGSLKNLFGRSQQDFYHNGATFNSKTLHNALIMENIENELMTKIRNEEFINSECKHYRRAEGFYSADQSEEEIAANRLILMKDINKGRNDFLNKDMNNENKKERYVFLVLDLLHDLRYLEQIMILTSKEFEEKQIAIEAAERQKISEEIERLQKIDPTNSYLLQNIPARFQKLYGMTNQETTEAIRTTEESIAFLRSGYVNKMKLNGKTLDKYKDYCHSGDPVEFIKKLAHLYHARSLANAKEQAATIEQPVSTPIAVDDEKQVIPNTPPETHSSLDLQHLLARVAKLEEQNNGMLEILSKIQKEQEKKNRNPQYNTEFLNEASWVKKTHKPGGSVNENQL